MPEATVMLGAPLAAPERQSVKRVLDLLEKEREGLAAAGQAEGLVLGAWEDLTETICEYLI